MFPSLELIGWYTVAQQPTSKHIVLHEQFLAYTPNPILVILQPFGASSTVDASGQTLPLKAYEPTVEIRERKSRNVFVEATFAIETGEAERIAVDWSAKGGEGGTSCESHESALYTAGLIYAPISGISPTNSKSCSEDAA